MDEKKSVFASEPLPCVYMVHLGDNFNVVNYKSKSASVVTQECLRFLVVKIKDFSPSLYSKNKLRYFRKRDDEDHFSLMFDDAPNSKLKDLLVSAGFSVHMLDPQVCFVRIRPIPPFITQDDLDKKLKEVFPHINITGTFSTNRAGIPFAAVLRVPKVHKQDVLSWKNYNAESKLDKLSDFTYEERVPPSGFFCRKCFKKGHTKKYCLRDQACEYCGGSADHSLKPCDSTMGCLFCQNKDHSALRCPLTLWPWVPFNSTSQVRQVYTSNSSRPASAWPLSHSSVESDLQSLKQSLSSLQTSMKTAQETPPAWVKTLKADLLDTIKTEIIQDFGEQISMITDRLKSDIDALRQQQIGIQSLVRSLLTCLNQSSLVRSDPSFSSNLSGLIEHQHSLDLKSALISSISLLPATDPSVAPIMPSVASSSSVLPASPIVPLLPSPANQPAQDKSRKTKVVTSITPDEPHSDQQLKKQRIEPSNLAKGPSSSSARDTRLPARRSRTDNIYAEFDLHAADAIGPDSFALRETPRSDSSSGVTPMCTQADA